MACYFCLVALILWIVIFLIWISLLLIFQKSECILYFFFYDLFNFYSITKRINLTILRKLGYVGLLPCHTNFPIIRSESRFMISKKETMPREIIYTFKNLDDSILRLGLPWVLGGRRQVVATSRNKTARRIVADWKLETRVCPSTKLLESEQQLIYHSR